MEILYWISFATFFLWLYVLIMRNGVPVSLSETRYLVNERSAQWGHVLWIAMCTLVALPLMVVWLYHIRDNTDFSRILVYITCLGLIGVGIAGNFKDTQTKFAWHCTFALMSAAAAVTWIFIYSPLWFIIVPLSLFLLLTGYKTGGRSEGNLTGKPKRNAIVFYAEMICFLAIYMILYFYFK